ncbi:MAG: hypothetical protein RIM68_14840, partial [Arenibacter sp.]
EIGQDEKVKASILEIFGVDPTATATSKIKVNNNTSNGKSIHIPNPNENNLSEAIKTRLVYDVEFSPNPILSTNLGKFNYIHKIKDGKDIYFFSNSSDDIIETEVTLKGKLDLHQANPHNGNIQRIENISYFKINNQEYTKCELILKPVSSIFWIAYQY